MDSIIVYVAPNTITTHYQNCIIKDLRNTIEHLSQSIRNELHGLVVSSSINSEIGDPHL